MTGSPLSVDKFARRSLDKSMRLAFLIAAIFSSVLTSPSQASQLGLAPSKQPGVWPHSYSDVAPDPSIHFGTLGNGLRYALKRTSGPNKSVSMRLAFSVGSLDERQDERGFAHLLEHMAFRPASGLAEDSPLYALQKRGLTLGSAFNATTTIDQTVYKLDLPQSDPAFLEVGLSFLGTLSTEQRLDPAALEKEKGVVRSETALRDTATARAERAFQSLLPTPALVLERPVEGDAKTLDAATTVSLEAFRGRLYRPENAVLIIVGDIDLDVVAAAIAERFGTWQGGKAVVRPAPERRKLALPTYGINSEPGLPRSVRLAWALPYDSTADTLEREKRDLATATGLAVLRERLNTLAGRSNPPFYRAAVVTTNSPLRGQVNTIEVWGAKRDWPLALSSALEEHRRLAEFGPSRDEIERALSGFRARHQTRLFLDAKQDPVSLADHLVDLAYRQEVATSPAQNMDHFVSFAPLMTPGHIRDVYRDLFRGDPFVMLFGGTPSDSPTKVDQVLAKARGRAVKPLEISPRLEWPYHLRAPSGEVLSRQQDEALGTVSLSLPNGIRLHLKKTDFRPDEILVSVRFRTGLLSLPSNRASPRWMLAAFADGGTKALSIADTWRAAPDAKLSVAVRMTEAGTFLEGDTRPADLRTQLELLSAYISQPGFRVAAFERIRAQQIADLEGLEARPGSLFMREIATLTRSGDKRWAAMPEMGALRSSSVRDLKAFIQPILNEGPADVTVVGDLDLERAIEDLRVTFGALSVVRSGSQTYKPAKFPSQAAHVVFHDGPPTQAFLTLIWPTIGFYEDHRLVRVLTVTAAVIRNRLLDDLRVKQGLIYAINTASSASTTLEHYGQLSITAEAPAAQNPRIRAAATNIIEALANQGPTEEEVASAVRSLSESVEREERTNTFWLAKLPDLETPKAMMALKTRRPDLASVRARDVQAAALRFLSNKAPWSLEVVPSPRP